MPELIVTPAVDALVADYLRAALTPTPVSTKVPKTRPAEFVRVLLTGGAGRHDVVLHDAQVTVEAWANDLADASELIWLIDAHMNAARFDTTSGFRDVKTLGGPVDLPDPLSGQSRYTATYIVTVRASV